MNRGRTTGSTTGWGRWLLALTLCVFALAYGAPTSMAAHATIPEASTETGCPDAAGHWAAGPAETGAAVPLGCCIAHCLPAMPGPLPAKATMRSDDGADAAPRDEDGEGWAAPVLLPPPRA